MITLNFIYLFQLLTKTLVVVTPNTKTTQHMLVLAIMFLEEDARQNARRVIFHVKVEHTSRDVICCV